MLTGVPTFHEHELVLEKSSDLLSPHVTNGSTGRLCGRDREDSKQCHEVLMDRQTDR